MDPDLSFHGMLPSSTKTEVAVCGTEKKKPDSILDL